MMQDYDGIGVRDANDDKVGTVERTYVDSSGVPRFVEVEMGTLLHTYRLVPAEDAKLVEDELVVPYAKDTIEGSPEAPHDGETLEGDLLDQIHAYYDLDRQGVQANEGVEQQVQEMPAMHSETAISTGQVRDLGDVIEVPIVEEVLVKQPVVKEVLRIRKRQVAESRTIRDDVRKEDVEVEQEDQREA
jgi:hypothetical protein